MNRNRTLFWPALLILVGAVALLVNLGVVPTDRLYRLADLWPVLLVILGLELLVNQMHMPPAAEVTASVLIVAVAVVGAGIYVALGAPIATGTQTINFSEPASGVNAATLQIDGGASTLHIQGSTSLTGDLFQAQVKYSGPEPTESFDQSSGRVVIAQNGRFGFFGHEQLQVDVQLNTAVPWKLLVHSGASKDTYDLPNVNLTSVEIDTGASTEDLTLPNPSGTVPVRINGGALTVHLHRPSGAAASVKVSGGSVSLTFDGDRISAVGSVSHATDPASDSYDVTVSGGACTVTMDTNSALD